MTLIKDEAYERAREQAVEDVDHWSDARKIAWLEENFDDETSWEVSWEIHKDMAYAYREQELIEELEEAAMDSQLGPGQHF